MAKKRSAPGDLLIWWGLVVVVASIIAWILWKTSRPEPRVATTDTNTFDIARATNVLQWLRTNKPAASITLANTNIAVVILKTNPPPAPSPILTPPPPERPVKNILEAQIALARIGISSGPIDGVAGSQTHSALRSFQKQYDIPQTGDLDATTRAALLTYEPVLTTYLVTPADLSRLHRIPETWLEKSQLDSLDYETILELVAEKHFCSQPLIRSLNPTINWTNVGAITAVKVPHIPRPSTKEKAAFVRIQLAAKILEAFDRDTNLLAHFPCSIAARVEKRPVGELHVVTGAENPNYSFDPEVFPESEEGQRLGRKLIIPPGPNNPVGSAWISLDKPGYGIHGTPKPEQVGRTESHGCFRLANWNAEHLLKIVWGGMPVYVEP